MSSSAKSVEEEMMVNAVRSKLNKERVKLWDPPYSNEDGLKGMYPEGMIERYATDLKMDPEQVASILEQLRKHSVGKLQARKRMKDSGLTILNVKIAGKINLEKAEFPIEISLQSFGSTLREKVSTESKFPANRLKLIGCGHVIVDDAPLFNQHIRPESQIMAIILSESEAAEQAKDDERRRLQEARKDAEILSSQSYGDEDDESYVQIADQSGQPINLPNKERKALMLAMTLHERGRAALRRKEYEYSLLLLLEADEEFSKCRSSILNSVDNYALLCLDISWCYLCLRSVEHLPDADSRLKHCEESLNRSYGANLERLTALKGNTCNEQALLMRLHLLQGIVAFYHGQYVKAASLFRRAETELDELKIDDGKLSHVMAMGFKATEARLALRNARGDVERAVTLIIQKREERAERKKKEQEKREKKLQGRLLGTTLDNQVLNVDAYNSLLNMGYTSAAARESLRQANNDLNLAIELLHGNPAIMALREIPGPSNYYNSDVTVAEICSMGFNKKLVELALQICNGSVGTAIARLTETIKQPDQTSSENFDRTWDAFQRIRKEVPEDEEAHLDLTLEEEMSFLDEYKVLLAQAQGQ